MKQKVTRFALTLLVMMLTMTQAAWAQTTITPTTPSQDGDGFYSIGSAAELYGFADLVNSGNASANAKLTADIVVNENVLDANGDAKTGDFVQWTPIGNDFFEDKVYSGTFDGQGHTISGLYVSGNGWFVGFVGQVSGTAVVKNLGIVDSYFSSSNNNLGSIVGGVAEKSSVTIANVYSTSTVNGDNWIGGLVGSDGTGSVTIINSYFAGKTSSTYQYGSHHDDLVSGDFDRSTLTVCNAFVLGTSQYGTSVTAGQLSDGTVAAALHYYQDALADGSMFGLSGGKTNFSGTIDGVSVTTANITLHTFDGDATAYSSKYIVGNTTPLPVMVEREGYTFFGWYDNADLEGDAVTSISSSETGNKEYWAKFERSHAVSFVLGGGTIRSGEIDHYIEGETTALPTFVLKNGASFEGWYTTENFTGSRYYSIPATATEDMTFYAKWGAEKTTFYLGQGPEPVSILYEGENMVWLDKTTMERYVIFDNFRNYWGSNPGINVPYTGEESTFGYNRSELSVAQSGFYVFTLTDKGEGNWFVSVLKSMLNCDVASIPTQTYTGSAIEPVVTVKDGETTLTLGTDYEVAYSNNVNAGTATVTITGKGNYSGETAATFTIVKSMTNDGITIAAIADQTYTGSAIEPAVTVKDGETTLALGTDYTIGYSANVNVGTATATITGMGNYSGSREATFTILPSTVMVSVTGNGTVTYNDRSATDGTSFGVMSEKGASVVLTLAPTDGYAARSVAYGYTNNSGTTASGIKLPISGTTATLTVPDDLKDGTGVTVTVTFAPALNGGADEASAVALTDATVTDLGGGWYKVDSDISFDHTLNLLGDTHLIIADGKTMTVNTASNRGIYSDYTLFVSGEGALNVTTTSSGIAVCVGNYVQTGATVTASGYIGIRCKDDFLGFDFDNDFTFSGGQLTATGSGGGGIDADNDITLSCTNATDFIQASSYSSGYGAVKIADGKALTDGTEASNGMNGYSGTLTNEQRIAIGSKTLRRAVITSYVDASGTLHENVIAIPLDNTMTTLAAGWYVVNSDVAYTGTVTLSGDVKLILGDGCTMSFGTEDEPLDATIMDCQNHNLTIYGQSGGTGWLKAYSEDGINSVNYYTQYSGNVVIFDGNGACIYANNSVTLLGGTLDVESGEGANGDISGGSISILGGKLWARYKGLKTMSGMIILDYTNATDQIYVKAYNPQNGLQIADGKTLVDDYGVIWSGTLDKDQIEHGINNRTLKPLDYTGVTLTKEYYNVSATFDGSSETTVSIPVDVEVNSVTYNRAFTEGKPSTVMLPFSLGEGQTLTGGTLYKFSGVTKNETTGMWETTMTETATLQANTPYLLMPNNELVDGKVTFNLGSSWSTVKLNTTGGGNCLASDTEGWVFHGTYSKKLWNEVETHDYGFAATSGTSADNQDVEAGQFVRLTKGASAKPMRCYLSYVGGPNQARALTRGAAATDEELPSSIIVRLVGANGETTAIGTIDTKTGEMTFDSEAWYTLDGVRLSGKPSKKGLYINNGKKVVIK